MAERVLWDARQHESKIEQFYGRGVEHYGNYHGGYLNFGLWENGNTDYVTAAQRLVLHMCEKSTVTHESNVLNVGCGMGSECIDINKNFGCSVTGCDATWKHVKHAQERIERENIGNVYIDHGTATQLRWEKEIFTHVLAVESAEHFNTREQFVKEAHRVLKNGGKLCLADFALKRKPATMIDRIIVEIGARLWHVPRANYETIESYKEMLERNGFANVVIEERGRDVIPGYFYEQHKPETRKAVRKIRGWVAAYPGHLIDYAVRWGFLTGLIEYVFVTAEKKC